MGVNVQVTNFKHDHTVRALSFWRVSSWKMKMWSLTCDVGGEVIQQRKLNKAYLHRTLEEFETNQDLSFWIIYITHDRFKLHIVIQESDFFWKIALPFCEQRFATPQSLLEDLQCPFCGSQLLEVLRAGVASQVIVWKLNFSGTLDFCFVPPSLFLGGWFKHQPSVEMMGHQPFLRM